MVGLFKHAINYYFLIIRCCRTFNYIIFTLHYNMHTVAFIYSYRVNIIILTPMFINNLYISAKCFTEFLICVCFILHQPKPKPKPFF